MAKDRKPFDTLAPLKGETTMLAAVVADPGDEGARLVYSDWLQERDDPRGAFLREFVYALQAGKDLPIAGEKIPSAWQEMVGLSLLRRLAAAGVARHRGRIMKLARPVLALSTQECPEGRIESGATKFGGRPDLPDGFEWPTCEMGPLEFLAQLDLKDLQATFAGRALPDRGLLSFFMYHNYHQDEYGNGRSQPPEWTGWLRIIHTPTSGRLQRLDPPEELTEDEELSPPRKSCRITFVELLDLPEPNETWKKAYGPACEPLREAHDSYPDRVRAADHQLFGYARTTVIGEDPIPGPDWQLLLGFTSDDKLRWNWGDGHHLFWYIKTADLRRGCFDDTQAIDG